MATSSWGWRMLASSASVMAAFAVAAALIWPSILTQHHEAVFLWLTLPPGALTVVSYAIIMFHPDAKNGLSRAKEGLFNMHSTSLSILWALSAAAYVYLYVLCASNADAMGNDALRFAVVQFTLFPLSAASWSLSVWDDTVDTNGYYCVRITAALSLGFVILVGKSSTSMVWLQWVAAVVLIIQHVFIDGILWIRGLQHLRGIGIHGWAAGLHILSALTIYIYGMETNDYDTALYKFPIRWSTDFDPYEWIFKCRDETALQCNDDDKNFSIRDRYTHTYYVHVLALTAAFAAWSGFWHMVAAGTTSDVARLVKWPDYAGSAPMMLIVISIQYGHHTALGIVAAPILLGGLILSAGYMREQHGSGISSKVPWTYFITVVALYALTWVPSGYTFSKAFGHFADPSVEAGPNPTVIPGTGEPPKFVWAFYGFTVAVFSSFPVVYALQMANVLKSRVSEEKAYIALSLIAKLTLHLFVGLTVISTAGTLDESKITTMDTLVPGIIGALCIIIFVIGVVINVKLDDEHAETSYTVVFNPVNQVYEGFLTQFTQAAQHWSLA